MIMWNHVVLQNLRKKWYELILVTDFLDLSNDFYSLERHLDELSKARQCSAIITTSVYPFGDRWKMLYLADLLTTLKISLKEKWNTHFIQIKRRLLHST